MRQAGLVLAAVCVFAAPCVAQDASARYLGSTAVQALADAVPPAPIAGSPQDLADIAASDRLRALEDTDRWRLATRHAELRPSLALAHFDCALGFRLTAETSPRLAAILQRVFQTANEAAERAKAKAFRPRPIAVDPARHACQGVSPAARASASYPSGSATVGSAYGALLAALDPERSVEALRIGHEIGVSRAVCAMHYPSDVAAGETLGQAVFQEISASTDFQADAPAAREEIAAARAAGLTSPACAAERAALATPLP